MKLNHIDLQVSNVRATFERLARANVEIKTELSVGGQNIYFMCVGPDGIMIEVRAPSDERRPLLSDARTP